MEGVDFMRSKILLIIVLAVCMVVASLVFTSCGDDGGDGGGKVTVKIGLTAPLSGPGGGYGEDVKQGLDMAVAEINEEGGLTIGDTTYIFELVPRDDAAEPERAIANAQQLVLEEGINIIFDPYTSTIVPLLGFNTNPGEEFLIMCYTSIPIYEDIPNRLMVTEPPPFYILIPEYVRLATAEGWTRCAFVQTTERYGEIWGDAFKAAWTAAGGEVVAEAPASYYTESDFTPYLTTVLAANPDVLFVGGPSYPTALVMEQARSLGFTGGFICMDQAKLDEIVEVIGIEAMEGTIGVQLVERSEFPGTALFVEKYKETYGEDELCMWEQCINYTGFHVLVKAMEAAGSVDDVYAIRDAFAEGEVSIMDPEVFPIGYYGVVDETGQLLMVSQIAFVQNGEFQQLEAIEWWTEE
jgi:branched-chain amino acid transport system substrate-binding protein